MFGYTFVSQQVLQSLEESLTHSRKESAHIRKNLESQSREADAAASKQQAEFGAAKSLLNTTCKDAQQRAYIADQEIKMLGEKLKTNDLEVHRLIQRIENLVPEAASSRAVMFEAALDEACARLPPTPLILLLNNIRRAVLSLSFFN